MADENQSAEQGDQQEPAQRSGLMTAVKAIAFVSVIVLLEVAAASMLLPSADDTRKIGEKLAAAHDNEAQDDDGSKAQADPDSDSSARHLDETREVSLGSFHVVTYNAESRTTLNIDFNLAGVVLADEESDFFTLFESNEQRIKEQVIITVRGMSVTDFTDPNLGLIKRKILEKTNRALGKPLLHEAIISEFAFVER